jgi:hypothetical protein
MLTAMTHPSGRAGHVDRRASARSRRYGVLAGGALLAGAVGYVGLVDPHKPDSVFPSCPFRLLTGWNCPMCGGLRMTHDVLHGDLAAAVADNVFLLVGMPLLALWLLQRRYRRATTAPAPAIAVVVIVTFAWTVLRNLPGFPLVPLVDPS